ncbi:MAG TPA: hypothetical protein V6D06_10010, partial [Trichocoleus sp.]
LETIHSELEWLREQVDSLTCDRAALLSHQQELEQELAQTYQELAQMNQEIQLLGRGSNPPPLLMRIKLPLPKVCKHRSLF